jgi:iron-sulfur cluster assembly accessory protein
MLQHCTRRLNYLSACRKQWSKATNVMLSRQSTSFVSLPPKQSRMFSRNMISMQVQQQQQQQSTTTAAPSNVIEPSITTPEPSELTITDACASRINYVNEQANKLNRMLRVTIEYGGCNGYKADFEFSDQLTPEDVVFEKNGAKVVVDKLALQYIKGATIDFVVELGRAKFQIPNNPNADSKCSCGSSFNVDITKVM